MKLYIYEYRTKAGLSMQELSEKSGVAKSYIQRMEDGTANPTLDIICKLANALDVSVHLLFECEEGGER